MNIKVLIIELTVSLKKKKVNSRLKSASTKLFQE